MVHRFFLESFYGVPAVYRILLLFRPCSASAACPRIRPRSSFKIYFFQIAHIAERTKRTFNRSLKCYAGNVGIVKSVLPNAVNAFWYGYSGKAGASYKSHFPNAVNAVPYGYASLISLYIITTRQILHPWFTSYLYTLKQHALFCPLIKKRRRISSAVFLHSSESIFIISSSSSSSSYSSSSVSSRSERAPVSSVMINSSSPSSDSS